MSLIPTKRSPDIFEMCDKTEVTSKNGAMSLNFDFTAAEIIEDGRCDRKHIEEIKDWMKSMSLPKATEEQIVLFLISCCSNIESTKSTILSYYRHMYLGKNITNNRNIHSKELIQQIKIIDSVVIPKRTKDNCMVIFQRIKNTSYWNFDLEPSMKFLLMTLDLGLIGKPPPDGLVALFDMTGVGIMHLTRLRLGPLKFFFQLLQEALPCRIKAIHILNTVYFVDKLVAMLKPFMKQELYDKVILNFDDPKLNFHLSNIDMEEFFENCLEAECVPSDYGGKLPSVTVLSESTLENMKKRSDWFEVEESLRKDYKP